MSMFNDISCGTKDNEQECLANTRLVSLYARNFGKGQWSFLGPGSEKKWYSISADSPQGEWDTMAEKMMLELAESGCPMFRATSPLSRGQLKSEGGGTLSIHYCADLETIQNVFRTIISVTQLSIYGAVSEFDRINLDSKIPIKYIDTKNQLADILTKGNFTRDEWNHLLCLFNISRFSSTVCSKTMAKRSQHDSGEERVTAKSRPMMSLFARVPSNVSSSTSASPGKRSYENQDPWSTIAEKKERSERHDIGIE